MRLVINKNVSSKDPDKAYRLLLRNHGPAETTYEHVGYLDEWTAREISGSIVDFHTFEPGDNYVERRVRATNPALKEAWENYQTLLALAKDE